jgi:hypothetical protein
MSPDSTDPWSRLFAELAIIRAQQAEIKARLPAAAAGSNRSLPRKAAAAYLGIHEKTLAELTTTAEERGMVTGYRTGTRWKYRLADLDRYRAEQLHAVQPRARREAVTDWGA